MEFYDANLLYGAPLLAAIPKYPGMRTIAEIDAALLRAGAKGGLIHGLAADVSGVVIGNRLLADDLRTVQSDLYGMYTIVPSCCDELPKAEALPEVMKRDRMMAIRFAPSTPGLPGFVARPAVLADYLGVAMEAGIPVVLDTAQGVSLEQAWDYMEAFPKLTAILGYKQSWPVDRGFRPFLEHFPNVYLDLASMITDQGIEHLAAKYGAERLLYATRYPTQYMGGNMLMLRAAEITEEQKALIAGGNFLRIAGWMQ